MSPAPSSCSDARASGSTHAIYDLKEFLLNGLHEIRLAPILITYPCG